MYSRNLEFVENKSTVVYEHDRKRGGEKLDTTQHETQGFPQDFLCIPAEKVWFHQTCTSINFTNKRKILQ